MRESDPEYFKNYYLHQAQQKGGHLPAFRGGAVQRGYGLGSVFRGLYRWAIPHLRSGIKAVGQHALKEDVGVAQDVLNGENLGDSLTKRGKKAIGALTAQNASQPQSGGGRKPVKRKAPAKRVSRASTKRRKTTFPKNSRNNLNNFFN